MKFDIVNKCISLLDFGWDFMSMILAMFKLSLLIVYLLFECVLSSHFCGVTISWKPSDKEGEVSVTFKKQLFSYAPKNNRSEKKSQRFVQKVVSYIYFQRYLISFFLFMGIFRTMSNIKWHVKYHRDFCEISERPKADSYYCKCFPS